MTTHNSGRLSPGKTSKLTRSRGILSFFTLLVLALSAAELTAQISIPTANSTYTENFNGMGTGNLTLADDITGSLPGFHAFRQVGNTNPNDVFADNGSDPGEGFKNYGESLQLDRSFGVLPGPGTGFIRFGARFVNNSGATINTVQLTFTGEQWRNSGSQAAQTLVFAYRKDTNVNDLTTGVYTAVPGLAFTSPNIAPGAGDVNGNLPGNRTTLSATFAVEILPGEEIMLRWEMSDEPGDDHGLSIDDLSVSTLAGGPTAAPASIVGRVIDANGRGIARTRVVITGGTLTEPLFALTNAFGFYRFDEIETGHGYVLSVQSKGRRFENPTIFVNLADNMTGIDFVALP